MRSRNIKSSFFTNEHLAVCSWPARLLFIGLWCVADREGRFEDRPLRIKGQVFPFDDIDVAPLLDELASQEFIVRYEASGRKCFHIPNFLKHQTPHRNEAESILPPLSVQGQNDSSNGQKPSPLNEERGKRNHESGMRKDGVSDKSDALPDELRPWLAWWNRLRAEKLVQVGVDAESPSAAVLAGWKRVEKYPEVRSCMDPCGLEKAIRKSALCRQGWFTLPKLFGGKNKVGELICQRLLEGAYFDNGRGGNGKPRDEDGSTYNPDAMG